MRSLYRAFAFSVTLCMVLILTVSYSHTATGQIRLTWEAPETNVDGSPLSDLAGHRIYYWHEDWDEEAMTDVADQTSYLFTELEPEREYVFYVTAYDVAGNESDPSDTVTAFVAASTDSSGSTDSPGSTGSSGSSDTVTILGGCTGP
jgi:Fibronectin type III domain